MMSKAKYMKLRKKLEQAGWELEYTAMAGDSGGSLWTLGNWEFRWTPRTTEDDVLNAINLAISNELRLI